MLRCTALPGLLWIGLVAGFPGLSAPPQEERGTNGLPFVLRNPEEPDEMELLVFAKQFCVAMRERGGGSAAPLRAFIDPRYLRQHNLEAGPFPIQTAAVVPIFTLQVADDRKTVLCVVGTRENAAAGETVREAILLRVTVHEGKLYLLPVRGPDPATGSFNPWILRTRL